MRARSTLSGRERGLSDAPRLRACRIAFVAASSGRRRLLRPPQPSRRALHAGAVRRTVSAQSFLTVPFASCRRSHQAASAMVAPSVCCDRRDAAGLAGSSSGRFDSGRRAILPVFREFGRSFVDGCGGSLIRSSGKSAVRRSRARCAHKTPAGNHQ